MNGSVYADVEFSEQKSNAIMIFPDYRMLAINVPIPNLTVA